MERMLATGVVGSPHGVQGYLKVRSFSGEVDHLLRLKEVTVRKGGDELRKAVEDVRTVGADVVMKLAGVDSPEAGRTLNGWELWVDRGEAAALGNDEYYIADLLGCAVKGADGERGVITGATGERGLVPFVGHFIGAVRLDERWIELRNEWVLD